MLGAIHKAFGKLGGQYFLAMKINSFPNNDYFSVVGAVGANGFVEKTYNKRNLLRRSSAYRGFGLGK